MGANPVWQTLRIRCFGIRKVAGAQDSDKNLTILYLTGGLMDDRNRLSTVIDIKFLSCKMNLTHGDIEFFCISSVEFREKRILIPVRILRFVLVPQKHQSNTFTCKLAVDVLPDWKRAWGFGKDYRREEKMLKSGVVQFYRQRP